MTFQIAPRGPFSLRESALFGFGHRSSNGRFDGTMRLAFCADDFSGPVGVAVRQSASGLVTGTGPASARDQVARMLSLDHDADDFLAVGDRDPVIGVLQRTAPGLRPPLFHSPYEAAVWAVLSSRRTTGQARALRERLARSSGSVLTVAGEAVPVLPPPSTLLTVTEVPGLPDQRVAWLHDVARAALDGRLDPATLAAQPPAEALASLRRISGIGPFSATLILVRACGVTDVLPTNEPRVLAAAGQLYRLGRAMTPAEFEARAEAWRPWRTWSTVLIRAVTPRLHAASSEATAIDSFLRVSEDVRHDERPVEQLSSRG
jgi:DNA-3-methyladenine glycosylase II